MARKDIEDFQDQEVTRIYLAGELNEAKRVESILTSHGIEYAVVIEPYRKLLLGIFPSRYSGAGFFVRPAQADFARSTLLAAGLKVGIQE